MEKKLEGKKCPKFSGDCTGNKNLSNDLLEIIDKALS